MRFRSHLAIAAAAALLTGPAGSQDRYNSADYQRVTHALTCQCGGCNAIVGECAMDRCPSSEPIREEVAERLQAGEAPEDIISMFAERYGLVILSAPPTSGFHLSAWILPGVFLLGGAAVVFTVLRRRRSAVAAAPAGGETAVPAVDASPEVLARIERDVEQIR